MNGKELIEDFESMRNMAELKALSKVSLERPLSNEEYTKMMMLKNAVFPTSDEDFKKKIRGD